MKSFSLPFFDFVASSAVNGRTNNPNWKASDTKDAIVLLGTGFKDINHKEIFEGDILACLNIDNGEVFIVKGTDILIIYF